jgi:hypothetical protein
MLVLECYDPQKDLQFVRSQILFTNEECEPFVYDSNSLSFLKTSQWLTNGDTLLCNVPNQYVYFFDLHTGQKIDTQKSEHLLISYNFDQNRFFSIRSFGSNQCLFEVGFDNFHLNQTL